MIFSPGSQLKSTAQVEERKEEKKKEVRRDTIIVLDNMMD